MNLLVIVSDICYSIFAMDEQNQDISQLTKKERKALRRQERLANEGKTSKNKLMKRVVLWGGIIVVLGAAIFGLVKFGQSIPSTTSTTDGTLSASVLSSDHIKGSPDAKVVLVEYSDFQCPACASYYPLLKKLSQDFGDKIKFVYRYFPLRQIHRNADLASYAAEAAGNQGKFWEMHDKLFDGQRTWSEQRNAQETFMQYAEALGLNKEQFQKDMDSDLTKEKVESAFQSGLKSDVDSTPSFFLNGKKIKNPTSYEEFKSIITAAIGQNS